MKILSSLLLLTLTLFLFSCENEESKPANEYTDTLPNMEMLNLTSEGETSKGDMSPIREGQIKFFNDINNLLKDTDDIVQKVIKNVEPTDFTNKQGKECKAWNFNGERNHWLLVICKIKPVLKQYSYALAGRPLTSTDDNDYKILFGGFGNAKAKYLNKKRGFGFIGYNFNNYKILTGADISGFAGIGYRAVGKVRQINIAVKDLMTLEMTQAYSALYRYKHIVGMGGVFRYLTKYDFLKKDTNDKIILGEDQLQEVAKRVTVWSTTGEARVATLVCNGTLGEGNCILHQHCWSANGNVTFDNLVDPESNIEWNSCGKVTLVSDLDSYQNDDFEFDGNTDDESGAPMLSAPTVDENE